MEITPLNDLEQIKNMILDLREGIERLVKGQILILDLLTNADGSLVETAEDQKNQKDA